MSWDRILWGVKFHGGMKDDKPFLIGQAWHKPMPKSQYDGEPSRVLLFCTREKAREWCRARTTDYAGHFDCAKWRFTPVRVRETVVMTS